MAIISDSIIYNLILALIILSLCFYLFFTSTFNYWKDRGIPYVKPTLLFGNLKDVFLGRKHLSDVHQEIYDQLEGKRYGGYFEMKNPTLIIRDPELVQQLLIKDFTHFYDRGMSSDPENDPLSANLVNLTGENWRQLRYKLTPTFTTGKLKGMFEQICKCGEEMNAYIERETKINKALDSRDIVRKFSLDVIASCAFGLQMDKDNEMTKNYDDVVQMLFRPSRIQLIRQFLLFIVPKFARMIGIKSVPDQVEKTVMKIINETVKYRRESNVSRNDYMQLILNLQKQEQNGKLNFELEADNMDEDVDQMKHAFKDPDAKLNRENKAIFTETCIAAQSFIFLVAGSEAVATPTSYTLFALAQNPQIQKKVHEEIDSVMANHKNKWSYEMLKEMTYLDQVIQESFRKYSFGMAILRICTQTYKIPGTNDVIEKGTRLMVPVHAIHNDPNNHRKPEVFDPDRFVDNNYKPSGAFLPFGDGPRICIAMRFALLEMKVALTRILSRYTVKLDEKTKLPLKLQANSFVPLPEGGLWFQFERRAND